MIQKNKTTPPKKKKPPYVGIVGMGYVGLPLAREFCRGGAKALGFDVKVEQVKKLNRGQSPLKHIPNSQVREMIKSKRFKVTDKMAQLGRVDAILICVPTPLTENREPDMQYVETTCRTIAKYLRKGQLVVLESTTYPGTTRELMKPILESSGLKAGKDFYLAYSPEREDPGNKSFHTATIPKVVGGLNKASLDKAVEVYKYAIEKLVPVKSCEVAESAKILENMYRCVNIAMVNELKQLFDRMKIDIWEVVEAAGTKPFGFQKFFPGPGLGGHCIPIDPFYLSWKAREYGIATRFIELAGEINAAMPSYVIQRSMLALNEHGKSIKGSRVLLVGLAYKKNVDDDRESPTYALWKSLIKHGAQVEYYDPYCPVVRPSREHSDLAGIESVAWEDIPKRGYDLALIATAHDNVNHAELATSVPLVVDTRGVCTPASHITKA